jgi:hypothetical protein
MLLLLSLLTPEGGGGRIDLYKKVDVSRLVT